MGVAAPRSRGAEVPVTPIGRLVSAAPPDWPRAVRGGGAGGVAGWRYGRPGTSNGGGRRPVQCEQISRGNPMPQRTHASASNRPIFSTTRDNDSRDDSPSILVRRNLYHSRVPRSFIAASSDSTRARAPQFLLPIEEREGEGGRKGERERNRRLN